jgi:hypothetical protein
MPPEDAGAAAATAGAPAAGTQQASGPATAATGTAGTAGTASPAAAPATGSTTGTGTEGDGDGLSAEELLAAATGDGDGTEGAAEDPAAQLAALKKQNEALKRHSRTWETRAKENTAAAAKLAEIEDANKTEIQRATDRAVQAEKRATDAEGLYHRTLACARYDLPADLIEKLTGSTEDEINASAESFAAAINERAAVLAAAQAKATPGQGATPPPGFRPVENLRPGAMPAGGNQPPDANAFLRAVAARKR